MFTIVGGSFFAQSNNALDIFINNQVIEIKMAH